MSKSRLDPQLRSVGQLFDSDDTYTVPVYQRNYAWSAEQIEQLISDVHDALADGEQGYFLGNLVVTRRRGSATDYEVIDGQQRLTTLFLLLTCLGDDGDGLRSAPEGRLRYESRPRATETLRRITAEVSKRAVPIAGTGTTEDAGIHEGYNVIQQFLEQHPRLRDEAARKEFANYLRHQVTVVRAALPAKTDLNRYFEIMNTRGQQLQQVDIVKARLMSHLPNEAERACFAWIWTACADMDSYVQMSLTRNDPNRRGELFGDSWSWLVAHSFDELLTAHQKTDNTVAVPGPATASRSLDAVLAEYAAAGTPSLTEDPGNVRFRSTIEFPSFLLHVLKVLNHDEDEQEGQLDDKRLIQRFDETIAAGEPGGEAAWVRNFALALVTLRNRFDAFVLKRQTTATTGEDGDWSLQRLLKRTSRGGSTAGYINTFSTPRVDTEEDGDVDQSTGELLLLESMLRVTYTSPRTMHWITRLLSVVAEADPEQVKSSDLAHVLREYARGKVREAFPAGDEPQGFHIGRVVFTYLDYLLLQDEPRSGFRFSFRNSVEHFYPQCPDEQQSGARVSGTHLDLLGNLALVSVGANSKFSNSLPMTKAHNFRTTIEAQSPKLMVMAELTRQRGSWGDEEVLSHHDAMVRLLRQDLHGGSVDEGLTPAPVPAGPPQG